MIFYATFVLCICICIDVIQPFSRQHKRSFLFRYTGVVGFRAPESRHIERRTCQLSGDVGHSAFVPLHWIPTFPWTTTNSTMCRSIKCGPTAELLLHEREA